MISVFKSSVSIFWLFLLMWQFLLKISTEASKLKQDCLKSDKKSGKSYIGGWNTEWVQYSNGVLVFQWCSDFRWCSIFSKMVAILSNGLVLNGPDQIYAYSYGWLTIPKPNHWNPNFKTFGIPIFGIQALTVLFLPLNRLRSSTVWMIYKARSTHWRRLSKVAAGLSLEQSWNASSSISSSRKTSSRPNTWTRRPVWNNCQIITWESRYVIHRISNT